jgi:hypothetical protein
MKKLFLIQVDNHIDLITNSSSELFVLRGKTKDVIEEMIDAVYPDFRSEYELKVMSEVDTWYLDLYMQRLCSPKDYDDIFRAESMTMDMLPVPKGFTFNELYEEIYEDKYFRGNIVRVRKYILRNNKISEYDWDRSFITDENREDVINRLFPNGDVWFLFSLEDNPNYEKQELLESIGQRFHLG